MRQLLFNIAQDRLLWNGAITITNCNSNSYKVGEKTFFKENENKLANLFYFEEIWKNEEIQEHVFLWTRDSGVANFTYLQTLYITHFGGDCFCYITFSLLRRSHQQNVTLNLGFILAFTHKLSIKQLRIKLGKNRRKLKLKLVIEND